MNSFGLRWDSQRIREQRQYEKLRARYEGEDRSQDRSSSATRSGAESEVKTITTLWQSPEDISHMQIEPWLPVSIFGSPLPNIVQTYVFFFFLSLHPSILS